MATARSRAVMIIPIPAIAAQTRRANGILRVGARKSAAAPIKPRLTATRMRRTKNANGILHTVTATNTAAIITTTSQAAKTLPAASGIRSGAIVMKKTAGIIIKQSALIPVHIRV